MSNEKSKKFLDIKVCLIYDTLLYLYYKSLVCCHDNHDMWVSLKPIYMYK